MQIDKLSISGHLKFVLAIFASLSIMTLFLTFGLFALKDVIYDFHEVMVGVLADKNIEYISSVGIHAALNIVTFLGSIYLSFVSYLVFDSIYTQYAFNAVFLDCLQENPDLKESIFRGIDWSVHRLILVVSPLFYVAGACLTLLITSILLFNFISFLAGFSIGLTSFLFIFVLISLMLGFMLSLFISLWNFISTWFGFECVMAEPELSNDDAARRAEKLVTTTKSGLLFGMANIVLIIAIPYQIYLAVSLPDFIQITNLENLIIAISINVFMFALLRYISIEAYFGGLFNYYEKVTMDKSYYYLQLKNLDKG